MREASSSSLPLLMSRWQLTEEALVGLLMEGDCVYVCVCGGGGLRGRIQGQKGPPSLSHTHTLNSSHSFNVSLHQL